MTQRSSTRAPLPAADAVSLNVLAPLDVQKPRTHDDAPPFGDEQPSRRPVSTRWRLERGSQQFRFTLLFLAVLVVFSGYFAFDVPSITSIDLKEALRIDNEQLGLLFRCVTRNALCAPPRFPCKPQHSVGSRPPLLQRVRAAQRHHPAAVWALLLQVRPVERRHRHRDTHLQRHLRHGARCLQRHVLADGGRPPRVRPGRREHLRRSRYPRHAVVQG